MARPKTVERGVARKMYVEEGFTPAQIAKKLNVSQSVVTKWAKKYGWIEQREQVLGGRKSVHERAQAILRTKLAELEEMKPGNITPGLIDAVTKLYKVVDRARDTVGLFESAVVVAEEFVPFVRRRVPDERTRAVIFEVWEEFLEKVKD